MAGAPAQYGPSTHSSRRVSVVSWYQAGKPVAASTVLTAARAACTGLGWAAAVSTVEVTMLAAMRPRRAKRRAAVAARHRRGRGADASPAPVKMLFTAKF